jgi:S1/P1 Nuclease
MTALRSVAGSALRIARRAVLLLAVLIVAAATPAAAWDFPTHAAVARIAWDQLTPAARAEAARLLAAAPTDSDLGPAALAGEGSAEERARRHFVSAAYWPDVVRDAAVPARQERYHHSDWHWVNLFFDMGGPGGTPRDRTDLPPEGRIVTQLGALSKRLADPNAANADRAIALAWIEHLTGDLHQPLHATARVTEHSPKGDRGGNEFALNFDDLHGFWDGAVSRSYWRWFWESDESYGQRIAERVEALHPRSEFPADLELSDFEGWAEDSFAIAKAEVYAPELERGERPPAAYERKATEIARRRVALAGYRLGELLNRLLTPVG